MTAPQRDLAAVATASFIALALTIPTVLYSSMDMNLLGLSLPTFGLSMGLILAVVAVLLRNVEGELSGPAQPQPASSGWPFKR